VGRPSRAENGVVVALSTPSLYGPQGRQLAGRWGSRCGPFTVANVVAEHED